MVMMVLSLDERELGAVDGERDGADDEHTVEDLLVRRVDAGDREADAQHVMMSTPITVRPMPPNPPVIAVPPTTMAATTGRRRESARVGAPLKVRPTSMTPAKPAQAPETTKTAIFVAATGTPASSAADSELPIAMSHRRTGVKLSTRANTATIAAAMSTELGTRRSPMRVKVQSSVVPVTPMVAAPETTSATPDHTASPPSVTRNEGTCAVTWIAPCTSPASAQTITTSATERPRRRTGRRRPGT